MNELKPTTGSMKRDFNDPRLKFKGGKDSFFLEKRDFIQLFTDAFDNFLYTLVDKYRGKYLANSVYLSPKKKDRLYYENSIFWKETLLDYNGIGQRIKLINFSLIEWLPSSPGLFFTGKAEESRRKAEAHFNPSNNEYLPLGKLDMILGGIGSVRLGSEQNNQLSQYYLCGTSNGVSHEGIPLIVERSLYAKIISEIKENGYCKVDIIGTIEILRTQMSILNFDREIPKYCIVVEDFIKVNKKSENLTVTIATAFKTNENSWSRNNNDTYSGYAWTFCSFEPKRGDEDLVNAVNWINDYALRYSESSEILCDFDEHKNHFDTVLFSQREIMSLKFNHEKVQKISQIFQIFQITTGPMIFGDNIQNNSGTVINRSIVLNSFNKVKEMLGEDDARLLQQITEEVERSENKDAVEIMEGFHQELQKPEPKKSLLKSFWNGVVTAVPALITNTDKVLNIIEKVGNLLSH
jgi:hypothetical protein